MKFLEYSMEKDKSIKAVLLINGNITQCNIRVVSLSDKGFTYRSGRSKKEQFCKYSDILATAYARGDEEGK